MSVRSRAGGTAELVPAATVDIAKVFGSGQSEPAAMREAARDVSQMGMEHAFGPGYPIGPYEGYDRFPRQFNFQTGYNIATRPRTHAAVSFGTLKGLIQAYDVARICINTRIDSIRSLDWKLVAADGYADDVKDAINTGMAALEKPDRIHYYDGWLTKWLRDVLGYDAGCLYRLRNRAGRCIGLLPFDGTTIAPLLDYWGNPPAPVAPGEPEPEAFVQYVNGIPWNWLTLSDLIYEPYRPQNDSPYGEAPIETILLNANTDLRFQVYFLQRFTAGNLPAAFASAPETWTPDQIERFQNYWDGFMYGEQERKHQIRWIPGGSAFAWSNEKDFNDQFSLFLMRKTCAAFHVVPTDIGFTENSNYSTGESQADVQHRVGDLPLIRYIQRILTGFLQADLGLPLKFIFDIGEEQDDRLNQAQADGEYIDRGVVSISEIRRERFGFEEPEGRPVPRYIFTTRSGPVPLSALFAVAGPVDAENAAPDPHQPLPETAFTEVQGVITNPPLLDIPLAEHEYGPAALPPSPPMQVPGTVVPSAEAGKPAEGPVTKEADGGGGDAAPTAGITAETGITNYDLIGSGDDNEDEATGRENVAKAELAAFRRYARARRKADQWRDFRFTAVDPVTAHRLNDDGRLAVRKAAGEIAVAGLAVLAADTGRVLMLQRALDPDDPAGGCLEFPGGHLEGDESPLQAAWREWSEEAHAVPPPGVQTGTWVSGNGIYQGIVWATESEASVPVRSEPVVPNPDDPDGDAIEAIMWLAPSQLAGNPLLRPELAADLPLVLAALGRSPEGTVTDPADIAKAGGSDPKAGEAWPGWQWDLQAVAYWQPLITEAVSGAFTRKRLRQLAEAWLAAPHADRGGQDKRRAAAVAAAWLASQGAGMSAALAVIVAGMITDGWLIGAVSAASLTRGVAPDTGTWTPGGQKAARDVVAGLGLGAALAGALAGAKVTAAATTMSAAVLAALGRVLRDGAVQGLTADQLAAQLAAVLADPDLASRLASDAITQASGEAALEEYEQQDVAESIWADAGDDRVCPLCAANSAQGPVPVGQPFSSGDVSPPAHGGCRCALIRVRA